MMIVIVSGTPGTGKTTVAKAIAQKHLLKYTDVNRIIKDNKLSEGYDKERDCIVIDTSKLCLHLIDKIKSHRQAKKSKFRGLVIDSHLSHSLPPSYVDVCIITKCALQTLKKRLEERGYKEQKIRENLDAEIFDTCRIEALEKGHKVKVVWTDEEPDLGLAP